MIVLQWKAFTVKLDRMSKYLASQTSNFDGMVASPDDLRVIFFTEPSQAEIDLVNNYWNNSTQIGEQTPNSEEIQLQYRAVVNSAMQFGNKVMLDFATENVLMGITQDGMTNAVRKAMTEVMSALLSGSLYDAIYEIRQIPAESKDVKYVTDARLLVYVNKIETYLGRSLSTSL
jgi:hypothetical protein